MSSETSDLIISLQLASKYLFRFGGLFLVIFGNTGCILNIMVFTQKSLRKNPCAVYFLAANLFSFIFINSLLLSTTLENGYNISYITKSHFLCRLCFYSSIVANALSTYSLILASIDRVLITSSKVSIRNRSNLRSSYICIIVGTIFWLVFHSPVLAYTTITQIDENTAMCFYQFGPFLVFISLYSIIKEYSSIILLIIFGLWAVKNIRRLHRVTVPSVSLNTGISRVEGAHRINPKDRQFILMVFIDIIIFSICCAMVPMFLTEQQLTQYQTKSIQQINIEIFLKDFSVFFLYIPFSISCFTNLMVSKVYRNAIKNVVLCK